MNQHAAAPEFAMSFTEEAVLLERREGLDWRPLGQARFAEGDLAFVLGGLRDDAGGQSGELDTVLVIPEDQILYTSLTVPFGSDTQATIARALEALTPYGADELVFDWCPAATGDIETLRVAAVTRRTLEEAEDFAQAQGFRPSGFQARPGDDRFEGNPDFGPSRLAAEQFNRRPFSEPDLTQARVTAPVIDLTDPGEPQAPVFSRITPHVVVASAAAAPAAAEPATQADTGAAAAPQAGSAAEAGNRPVIRHGQLAQPGPALSPRAKAVHDRAAGARALRAEPAADQPDGRNRLVSGWRGLDLTRLPVMVALLAGLLVLGLWFLGRSPDEPQVAAAPQTTPDAPAVADPVAIDTAESDPVAAPEAPVATPEPAASDLAAADTETETGLAAGQPAPSEDDAAAPLAQPLPQAATPPATGAEADAPTAAALPDQEDDALTRALNEALGVTPAPQAAADTAATATAVPSAPEAAAQAATLTAALAPANAEPAAPGTAPAATAPVEPVPAETAPAAPAQDRKSVV